MLSHKYRFILAAAALFVLAGAWGCAHNEAMTNQGAIKSAKSPKSNEAAPSSASRGNGSAAQQAMEAPPGPKEQPEPVVSAREEKSIQDIHFEFNKYNIRTLDEKILNSDYRWVKDNKPGLVVIEGNCDERGTVEYNLALGERRAQAAKRYLIAMGVDGNRLKTISYGKSKPVDPGHDEAAWAKNRRDHFVIE